MNNLFGSEFEATNAAREAAHADGLLHRHCPAWAGENDRFVTVLFSDDKGGHVVAYWNGAGYEVPDTI